MQLLICLYLFVIGASLGSFAGAIAWRLEKRRDVVRERSECEHCHHVLSPIDLIPVVSWMWLRGMCRYCRKPIGYTAITLELVMGTLFAMSYILWPSSLGDVTSIVVFVLWLLAYTALAILFVYDMRHFLLPDRVMWPLIAIGSGIFVLSVLGEGLTVQAGFVELLLGLLPVAGLYWLLYTVSGGKWVGFGDVKLGIFIGLALGWQGALLTLLIANLLGTLTILPAMLSGKLRRTDHVPFGPFLIIGTVISLLVGDSLIRFYLNLLGV